jgi:hypothetical protein
MTAAAERMRAMRERKRSRDLREVRITVPHARSASVRQRVAAEVAGLNQRSEEDALRWIEAVSGFDKPEFQGNDEAR